MQSPHERRPIIVVDDIGCANLSDVDIVFMLGSSVTLLSLKLLVANSFFLFMINGKWKIPSCVLAELALNDSCSISYIDYAIYMYCIIKLASAYQLARTYGLFTSSHGRWKEIQMKREDFVQVEAQGI